MNNLSARIKGSCYYANRGFKQLRNIILICFCCFFATQLRGQNSFNANFPPFSAQFTNPNISISVTAGNPITSNFSSDQISLNSLPLTSIRLVPTSIADETNLDLPNKLQLEQNYPNPFNPSTTIAYTLPAASNVEIQVYNSWGSLVAELVNTTQAQGNHSVIFNASNIPSGMYIYTLRANNQLVDTKKMILIK
jgi:hypothetical protein